MVVGDNKLTWINLDWKNELGLTFYYFHNSSRIAIVLGTNLVYSNLLFFSMNIEQ